MSSFYTDEQTEFRQIVREFVTREISPNIEAWDERKQIPRAPWLAAAQLGILGIRLPEEYGGGGTTDYRFRAIVSEELARVGAAAFSSGISINEDIVSSYLLALGTDEQKQRWLPPMADGTLVASIAMSEPGTGSDLRGITTHAHRDGDEWVISGAKTFITNGSTSDVVLVAARTGERDGRATFSLILVPTDTPGFSRGAKLKKLGLHAQDTAELFFDNARVPLGNLVGEAGRGLRHLVDRLPLERLSIGWRALATAEAALEWTIDYTKQRRAFGERIIDFQNSRFRLAELVTEVEVTRAYLEKMVLRYNAGELDPTTAAKVKWWSTELQNRVVTACLQLHGGYGFMTEYPIARAFTDGRVQTIVGGTTEIMKELIGRDIAE